MYTGSLRKGNDQIYRLFDVIRLMQGEQYKNYRFLIYGKGDLLPDLREQVQKNGYENVRLKGFVDKKYIPYVLSKCDLNLLNCVSNNVLRYGGSQNKLFEYLASGKPIISGEGDNYSLINKYHVGISKPFADTAELVSAIEEMKENPIPEEHIRKVAELYDFRVLTDQLLKVIEKCREKHPEQKEA